MYHMNILDTKDAKDDDNIFGEYNYYDPDYDGVDYDDPSTT